MAGWGQRKVGGRDTPAWSVPQILPKTRALSTSAETLESLQIPLWALNDCTMQGTVAGRESGSLDCLVSKDFAKYLAFWRQRWSLFIVAEIEIQFLSRASWHLIPALDCSDPPVSVLSQGVYDDAHSGGLYFYRASPGDSDAGGPGATPIEDPLQLNRLTEVSPPIICAFPLRFKTVQF